MENLCAIVLAGGIGTRFWPKSTESRPKQFLNLISDRTMLQLTVDRINKKIPLEKIFVVVMEEHKDLVVEQIKGIRNENIIIQPSLKNTAPCILMATNYVKQIYNNTNIIVLPSDHLIIDEDKFLNNISKANDYVEKNNGIITLGIIPNRPETGYGYIKINDEIKYDNVIKIDCFKEKPTIDKALQYLKENRYLWNAGIFLFNVNYILNLYKNNLKNTFDLINNLPYIEDINYLKQLKKQYELCDNISFDYAIMEKTNNNYVIPSNIGWDDIGTWGAIERYCDKDSKNNIIDGNVECFNSENNIIYGSNKKTILLGVNDLFFVDTDDVIVIADKSQMNKIYEYKKNMKVSGC